MTFHPPRLGPGAIYLRSLDNLFRSNADLIRVAEIEPQTLWTKGTAPGSQPRGSPVEMRGLGALAQSCLVHGIGSPIGGTICDQQQHIDEFRRWTQALGPPWFSEHLSILHVQGARGVQSCGFLMPPLQTEEQVELAARNILSRNAAVGRPFAFETGVNYFVRQDYEMPDGDFFAAVAQAADCGILLDLTNLWVNHKNGRTRIQDVLTRLPLERIWEVHLAGTEFAHGYWLDAHSGGIDAELVEIAADFLPSLPNLGAIIFELAADRVSSFGATAFLHQMETLSSLWPATPVPMRHNFVAPPASVKAPSLAAQVWERVIAHQMLPAADRPPNGVGELKIREVDEQSFALYRHLTAAFRAGTIAEMLENTTRLLLIGMGEPALRELMHRYISLTPPASYPTDEALSFRRFLDANAVPVPGLSDMLKFEAALVEAAADSRTLQVTFTKDIELMLSDIREGRMPGPSSDRPETVLEIGVEPAPFIRMAATTATAVCPQE